MKFNHYSTLLLISLLGLLTACSEDIVTVPKSVSSAKAITKLVFSQFFPMAGLQTSRCVRKQDYRQKLLSHDGWSGDAATGHRGLPAKEKELTGYHIDASEIDVYPGFYGTVALPNPANPNFPDVVTIGTSSNPIQRGKAFVTDILDYINENMPYTAKIEVEIPIGSGNIYLKNGVDGKRTIQGRSSMFPKRWDLDKIIEEVAYVRSRLTSIDIATDATGAEIPNLYSKVCSEGTFNIRMYINSPTDLNNYNHIGGSAFPEVR